MFVRYQANMEDLEKFANSGVDLVWISSHADASPRCAPYQGKLNSIYGTSGVIDGIKYEPLENALSGQEEMAMDVLVVIIAGID
ncbi:MAG TPA: phage minor capsid protein [Bacilli bacterium]